MSSAKLIDIITLYNLCARRLRGLQGWLGTERESLTPLSQIAIQQPPIQQPPHSSPCSFLGNRRGLYLLQLRTHGFDGHGAATAALRNTNNELALGTIFVCSVGLICAGADTGLGKVILGEVIGAEADTGLGC